jgi:hypothetical protein
MTGAVFSQKIENNIEQPNEIDDTPKRTITQCTADLEKVVDDYMNIDPNRFTPKPVEKKQITMPWKTQSYSEPLEWWVTIIYNGQKFEKKVDISIDDFSAKFLKHPEYGESIYFNVDSDPSDDIEVIIGFYWSGIKYPDGEGATSLESRLRVIQTSSGSSGGGLEDPDADMKVFSEIRLNYGLVMGKAKEKTSTIEKTDYPFLKILDRIIQSKGFNFLTSLINGFKNIFNRIINPKTAAQTTDDNDIGVLANSRTDYFALKFGYYSPENCNVPLSIDKRFAFAKTFNRNWATEGTIFNPAIFEHEIYDVSSSDPIGLEWGFKAYQGSTQTKLFDISFTTDFSKPVYLLTHYIPEDAYVYYNFDSKSEKNSEVEIKFSADVIIGTDDKGNPLEDFPEISLIFDKIDGDLARSGRWFSLDIDLKLFKSWLNPTLDLAGFKYKGSHVFDVDVKFSIPDVLNEKVQIKGLPKEIDFGWDVDVGVLLPPSAVDIFFNTEFKLDMSSDIEELTVFYPKTEQIGDDEIFINVKDIPKKEEFKAEASLFFQNTDIIKVEPSADIGMKMSSSIGEMNVYYPKAVANQPDSKFMWIPKNSIPSDVDLHGNLLVRYNTKNAQDSDNSFSGAMSHSCNKNIEQIDFYLPSETDPVFQMLDLPATSSATARLNWNTLNGEVFATRGYIGGYDPIIVNLTYGGFEVYNYLEIRNGYIRSSFEVANDGFFNIDTSKSMLADELEVHNNNKDSQIPFRRIYLKADEISAEDFKADWDIEMVGDQPKINDLKVSGIIDTIRGLTFDFEFEDKATSLDLLWTTGEQGELNVDFSQADPISIDFDILDNVTQPYGIDINGVVTLNNNPHLDMAWRWKQGQSATDPSYFRINYEKNVPLINDLDLDLGWDSNQDGNPDWGAKVTLEDVGIYYYVRWYWYGIIPYIWSEFDISGDIDVDLLLFGDWYENVHELLDPPS